MSDLLFFGLIVFVVLVVLVAIGVYLMPADPHIVHKPKYKKNFYDPYDPYESR